MRFAFALLFAYTAASALMGADVYAKPTLDLDKRGVFPLVHKRNPNPSKQFCDCCSAKKEQRAVCCAGIYDCDCADCNPPVLEADMEERDEDGLAARA